MITLTTLPYSLDWLQPVINAQTLETHYTKHHQWYVNKLNELIQNTKFENWDLESIIKTAEAGPIFNNAAQIRNHTFYWNSLRPVQSDNKATGKLLEDIENTRRSRDSFKTTFINSAVENFGSGRTRLVKNTDWKLEIVNTSNAQTPITTDKKPLLTIDIWEHAYYLDYQNRRPEYMANIRDIVNRDFVSTNYNG